MVDSSEPGRLADASVHLVETLKLIEETQKSCKLLIIFSKVDLLEHPQRDRVIAGISSLLQLSYLTSWCRYVNIQTTEYSTETDEGLHTILEWLQTLT